ncbi:hypothetical protein PG993_008798 [Apiospora rasikravindrae]|uniref:Uncharacterized protein n=1 Tax=Apiospora rasikravindrae TaxID=990691 RepID=A0ABR1SR39_9PEZI
MHLPGNIFLTPYVTASGHINLGKALEPYWHGLHGPLRITPPGAAAAGDPIALVSGVWLSSKNSWVNKFVVLENETNNCKGTRRFLRLHAAGPEGALRHVKGCLLALRYLQNATVSARLLAQSNRVSAALLQLNTNNPGATKTAAPDDDAALPGREAWTVRALGHVDPERMVAAALKNLIMLYVMVYLNTRRPNTRPLE